MSWPRFTQHADATCVHCGAKLDASTARDDGWPPKHGQYVARCPACKYGTWYDIDTRQEVTP